MDHKGNLPIDGEKIKALRKRNRLTQSKLARLIKIPGRSKLFSERHLRNIETGRTRTVHPETFDALMSALNVSAEEISPDKPLVEPSAHRSQLTGYLPPKVLYSVTARNKITRRSQRTRKRVYDSFLRSSVKWGPSFSSSGRRVANVCEVLLAFEPSFANRRWKEFIDPTKWLLSQQRQGGFPSLSRDVVTTHCTALGSLACAHIARWQKLPSDLRRRASNASHIAAEACLNMAGERGWGTWGKGSIRIQPTIWALRALAKHSRSFRTDLFLRFEQLRAMHSLGYPGCFGFRPGAERRISPTASFLLLCADLEQIGYKPSRPERYYLEEYNAAHYVASHRIEGGSWQSEVELYYVDPAYLPFVGNVEQWSWFHISPCLAVEALSRKSNLTGRIEAEGGWAHGALALLNQIDPVSGVLKDPVFMNAGLSEPTFPSAYACMALSAFENWIAKYEQIDEYPESPPPEIENALIRKAGAAIVKDGSLLLVRKFGTDQLIMPGGGVEVGETPTQALQRELREELGIEKTTIVPNEPIGVYRAPAAYEVGVDVEIVLYGVTTSTTPKACSEIEEIVWFHPETSRNRLSPIVRERILPSLKEKGIL
jgi:8-oxo-dGTP diphosphatase